MPLTVAEWQEECLTKVGLTSTSPWAVRVPILWRMYDVYPVETQAYLTQKGLLDYMINELIIKGTQAHTQADIDTIRAQRESLATMKRSLTEDYQRVLALRAPLSGELAIVAPISSPAGLPNANDPQYGGNPNPGYTGVQRGP